MRGRSAAGRLLLAAFLVAYAIQMTPDRGTAQASTGPEWRLPAHADADLRLPERRMIGVPGHRPETSIHPVTHLPVAPPRRGVLAEFSVAVFVPPRL
jgi:hypothetical protein